MGGIIAEIAQSAREPEQHDAAAAPVCQRSRKKRTIRLLSSSAFAPAFLLEIALSNHVYKHIELTGSSATSIEDAVSTAIAKASLTLRNIHWFEVVETRGHVENCKVAHWQVTIKVGFTLED